VFIIVIFIFLAGHYMFIETSAPRVVNDNALLSSPVLVKQTNDVCLQFYYHMFGQHIGTLNVKVRKSTIVKVNN